MATWRKINVDKWKTLWVKGNFVPGKGYKDWVEVQKTSLIGEWEVGAKRVINNKTNNKHFVFFKSKPSSKAKKSAMALASSYRRKY